MTPVEVAYANQDRGEQSVDRIAVCQAFLDVRERCNYLEIGVDRGASFVPIRAQAKWGVDPAYVLPLKRRLKYILFSLLRIKEERLFRMTSERFFRLQSGMLSRRGIDVAFVDGLHTYAQALSDVLNAVKYLKTGGVVVVHDCNPECEAAAMPATSINEVASAGYDGWNGEWNGDVYKVVIHLRSVCHDLQVVVLDCDQGLAVVRRGPAQNRLHMNPDEIASLEYSDFVRHRNEFLDLRPPDHLKELISQATT